MKKGLLTAALIGVLSLAGLPHTAPVPAHADPGGPLPGELTTRATPRAVPGKNIDVSRYTGYEGEEAVAINPTNPNNVVIFANTDASGLLFEAVTFDGGATWTKGLVGTGGPLGSICCDPTLAFDRFGNLFLGFLDGSKTQIKLALSTDGGKSFQALGTVRSAPRAGLAPESEPVSLPGPKGLARRPYRDRGAADVDQPTVTAGPSSTSGQDMVCVTYQYAATADDAHMIEVRCARSTGLGAVGAFNGPFTAPSSTNGNFGDIVIGPAGQLMVTYQSPTGGAGPSNIYVHYKEDGLGAGPLGPRITVTATNVGGFRNIPAQPNRSVDAEVGLAWDRSGGPFNGRLYLVYTDAPSTTSDDLNIYVRYSDNLGSTWSSPVKVHHDTGTNSQFFPKIALDQTTGIVAVAFYDTRLDPNNVKVALVAAISIDGGASFQSNILVSEGLTDGRKGTIGDPNELGDYIGLAFHAGVFWPAWADNSNSTGDNPDSSLDVLTAPVKVQSDTFSDVAPSYPFYTQIQQLYQKGITTGFQDGTYRPDTIVTREQMAVFLLRAVHGASYTPPAITSSRFGDVQSSSFFAPWIEQLAKEGITTGCNPPANSQFCPSANVNRDQMAVFLIRAKYGLNPSPPLPAATGTLFSDIATTSFGAQQIEQAKRDGITTGFPCGSAPAGACDSAGRAWYVPGIPVTRGQMAAFLIRAFP